MGSVQESRGSGGGEGLSGEEWLAFGSASQRCGFGRGEKSGEERVKKIRKGPKLGFAPLNVTLRAIINAHLCATEPQGAMEPNSTCSASTGRGRPMRFSTVYVYQLGGE